MNARWRLKPLLIKKQLVVDIFGHFCGFNNVPDLCSDKTVEWSCFCLDHGHRMALSDVIL